MRPDERKSAGIFTDEEIASFVALGEVLLRIRARLVAEGHAIKNGRITKMIK